MVKGSDCNSDISGSIPEGIFMKDNECSIGVGDGTGSHFVHGSYETIKLLQEKLLELETLRRIINRCPIIIETPYEVCDGPRIGTYSDLKKEYGEKIEEWVLSEEDFKDCERVIANKSIFLKQI